MAKYNKQTIGNAAASNKSASSKSKIITVSVVLVFIAAAVMIWNVLRPKAEKSNFIVTEGNVDTIQQELSEKIDAGMFEIRMNTEWTFESSDVSSETAYLANAESNKYAIYVDVIVDETGENVLVSPVIPVGSKMENITLQKELSAGTYPVTVVYHLVDEHGEEVSNVSVAATVIILN